MPKPEAESSTSKKIFREICLNDLPEGFMHEMINYLQSWRAFMNILTVNKYHKAILSEAKISSYLWKSFREARWATFTPTSMERPETCQLSYNRTQFIQGHELYRLAMRDGYRLSSNISQDKSRLRYDREFVLVQASNPRTADRSILYASSALQADKEIVLTALRTLIAPSAMLDYEFLMRSLNSIHLILPIKLRDDYDVIYLIAKRLPLQVLPEALSTDKDQMLSFIQLRAPYYLLASEGLKNDIDFIKAAVAISSEVRQYIPEALRAALDKQSSEPLAEEVTTQSGALLSSTAEAAEASSYTDIANP